MQPQRRSRFCILAILIGAAALGLGAARRAPATITQSRPTAVELPASARGRSSETFVRFPPILLPESSAPMSVRDAAGRPRPTEVVVAFTVDTSGRVEAPSVEVLSAPDSAAADAVRAALPGVRYVPARLVQTVGPCVRFDGEQEHCGGARPHVRRLRARVVLRVESFAVSTP